MYELCTGKIKCLVHFTTSTSVIATITRQCCVKASSSFEWCQSITARNRSYHGWVKRPYIQRVTSTFYVVLAIESEREVWLATAMAAMMTTGCSRFCLARYLVWINLAHYRRLGEERIKKIKGRIHARSRARLAHTYGGLWWFRIITQFYMRRSQLTWYFLKLL